MGVRRACRNGDRHRPRIGVVCAALVAACAAMHAGTPVPTYGTYFGGTGDNNAVVAAAVDPSGNIVLAGYTTSQTLPGTANSFQATKATGFPDNRDVFVAKFDPTGRNLQWATFLGGDGDDVPNALSVDQSGNVFVSGTTTSSTFPVNGYVSCTAGTVALQQRCSMASAGSASGFVAKLSPDGSKLLYSIGLPGVGVENIGIGIGGSTALAVDSQGTAYIAEAGASGLYLLHLGVNGTQIMFGTFLGGGGFNASEDRVTSVVLDGGGNIWVAGSVATGGVNLQTTQNAFQLQQANNALVNSIGPGALNNGFILQLNSAGSQVLYGTYFGPRYSETLITTLVAGTGASVYFGGFTNAVSFQSTPGAYLVTPSPGFVAKLTPGSPVLDAFSYTPSAPLLEIGNQPDLAYVTFETPGVGPTEGIEIAELSLPQLALASSFTASFRGFAPSVAVLAPPRSIWLSGACELPCALGDLISSNAFQSAPVSTSQNAVLIQLTDISPTISFLGSAATGTSPFAAGQLVSIYGTQLGPTPGSGAQVNSNGVVTNSNGGTQVLFDGVAAPILYTGASQVNAAVPCSVAGKSSTQLVVQYLGAQSAPYAVPLNSAAPGIFTLNGSGSGEGVVLNQDYSLNGPLNPAARGSAVAFYATGIGPTSPCVDGQTYQSNFPLATFSVIAGVGNLGAQVLYSGQAPYFMSGVDQINIVIPSGSPTGSVPLSLLVDGVFSPPGVTIAVK